jgi:hypothetical protein
MAPDGTEIFMAACDGVPPSAPTPLKRGSDASVDETNIPARVVAFKAKTVEEVALQLGPLNPQQQVLEIDTCSQPFDRATPPDAKRRYEPLIVRSVESSVIVAQPPGALSAMTGRDAVCTPPARQW